MNASGPRKVPNGSSATRDTRSHSVGIWNQNAGRSLAVTIDEGIPHSKKDSNTLSKNSKNKSFDDLIAQSDALEVATDRIAKVDEVLQDGGIYTSENLSEILGKSYEVTVAYQALLAQIEESLPKIALFLKEQSQAVRGLLKEYEKADAPLRLEENEQISEIEILQTEKVDLLAQQKKVVDRVQKRYTTIKEHSPIAQHGNIDQQCENDIEAMCRSLEDRLEDVDRRLQNLEERLREVRSKRASLQAEFMQGKSKIDEEYELKINAEKTKLVVAFNTFALAVNQYIDAASKDKKKQEDELEAKKASERRALESEVDPEIRTRG